MTHSDHQPPLSLTHPIAIILVACVFLGTASLKAQAPKPFLHPLFGDHAVLQRLAPVPIWGWSTSGTTVEVSLNEHRVRAEADSTGKWMARLPALPAGGPYELVVSSDIQNVTRHNILLGDVWICSGQSNMEQGIATTFNAEYEIAAAAHPNIRLLTIPKRVALDPQDTFEGQWSVCTPETVSSGGWGGFSAVGYFFGRALHQAHKVPIGLIHSSWGGTVAEAWTSAEALHTMADFRPTLASLEQTREKLRTGTYDFAAELGRWFEKNDPGSKASWSLPSSDTASWDTMALPSNWETAGLDNFDGIVWFRKEIDLPPLWAGKAAVLELGPIDDQDVTWVNGQQVGATSDWTTPRRYSLPGQLLRSGRNVIAVRVLDTGGGGGFHGAAEQMTLLDSKTIVALSGPWQYRVGVALNEAAPMPRPLNGNPNVTTVLYNGMIAPLLPCAIKGAIWYQGESNADRPEQYRTLLPTMIQDWRSHFSSGRFPFLIVQLANFMERQKDPSEGGWAELREAQYLTAKNDPMTGMAVITDIGEADDIHPRNKRDVGHRLALSAGAIAYGKKLVYSGPEYRSMRREGTAIRLTFDHVGSGLVAQLNAKLTGFAIAGEDMRFVWANARIDGNEIVVSSPSVPQPSVVRYNWANNPIGNLYNMEGLPASSFRTDAPE